MKTIVSALVLSFAQGVMAADAPPPPNLQPIEEPRAVAPSVAGSAVEVEPKPGSEVTVKRAQEGRIEEFRLKGRLYMIKVYPVVGLPYTLTDERGEGVFNRTDGRRGPGIPAQWKVLSW